MELVLAGAVGRRTAYPRGDGRDRGRHLDPVGSRSSPASSPAGCRRAARPTSRWRPSRSCRCSSASAPSSSQLAPTRRVALELGGAVVGLSLLLRVVADTSSGAGWLRWATPLGWAEELRPFTGPRPLVLLLPLAASGAAARGRGADRRAPRHRHRAAARARHAPQPRLRLLSSPTAQALRSERGSLIVWMGSVAAFAFILGVVSTSISLGRDLEEPAAGDREARLRLDRDAHRLPRLRVHLLRPGRQPVRVRAGRRRPARGGR